MEMYKCGMCGYLYVEARLRNGICPFCCGRLPLTGAF